MPRIVFRRIFPERVFGSAETLDQLEARDRTDLVAHRRHKFLGETVGRGGGLEHNEAPRNLTLDGVCDSDDGTLGHSGMRRQDGLDRAGRQPVSRNVDDVVDAPHHEQIPVLVEVAAVAGEVVPGMLAQI